MKLKMNQVVLKGQDGRIAIQRNEHGIPVIRAESLVDLAHGLGWVHASDRQLQAFLTRILLKGQAAEKLQGTPELIAIDSYMRTMNFLPDARDVIAQLEDGIRRQLEAYAQGFNSYISQHGVVYELKLLGYRPEPWEVTDTLILGKVFGFIGLADAQGSMEKLLIQMIQHGVGQDKLRELFPYLTEEIDYDLYKEIRLAPALVPESLAWLGKLPGFRASNNWAVSGSRTLSGKPIMCGDPHLEVNRLPAIWQEIVMVLPDNLLLGVTVPGSPGLIIGRTSHIAWSATYSFMDMLDYRVERCRNGQYWREDGWKSFTVRQETIRVKGSQPKVIKVYENEHGVLEGDPYQEGSYLVLCWSARDRCGADDFNGVLGLPHARSVKEAMGLLKRLDAASFNYVITDTGGNIGYQMSGRLYERPPGISGLLALPGWEQKYDPKGFVEKDRLPSAYNPDEGFIATANQDLNHLGQSVPINLPMGAYRAERIADLLRDGQKLTVEDMKRMHFDLYSLQAERLMRIIRDLLPATPNGRILKAWDMRYDSHSKGAMLFESVYHALYRVVFGDHGLGRQVVDHIMQETSVFNDYYANLDAVLMCETSAWFEGKDRDEVFKGKFPRFFGYDYGPVELPGCRATIPQGQIFRSAGRLTTFSPSYRFVTDMATLEMHTNIAGGPTDRRFSRWYTADVDNWVHGRYKVLK
ncbi:MAG: penicillin acylase family protein [Desulfobacterota bacterium]|nr:penicillin acylase family protein [Thermodesulfobacteriota bacterium]